MRTICLRSILMNLLVIVIVGTATYSLAVEKPIELRIANYYASAQLQTKIVDNWAKKLEQETNGRLRFTIFSDASLLSGPESWSGIVRGVADIGVGVIKGFGKEGINPYNHSTLVWAATYGAKDTIETGKIGDELLKTFPPFAEELAELKILSTNGLANLVFYSKNIPIRGLDDLRGRTIRFGTSGVASFVKKVGANPLFMAMPEVYMALDKGTIDIMAGFATNLKAYRHAEVARCVTPTLIPGAGPIIGFIGMNWNIWNKLPPDLKKVIEASCEKLTYESRKYRADEVDECLNYAKSKGCQIIEITPREETKIGKVLQEMIKNEVAEMNAKGLRGTEFAEAIFKAVEKYVKK